MSERRIDAVWPEPADELDDDAVLARYPVPAGRTWLRMNFVESLDGAATRDARSGGLGGGGDQRLFGLLRRLADVVLVGAGTARAEGYAAMRLGDTSAAWRIDRGEPAHPVLALVSGRLDLDPASEMFTDAPVRPIVYTVPGAPAERRAALAAVADVVDAASPDDDALVDPARVRDDLAGRGLRRIHAEGGPSLFGDAIVAGVVDELCLTLAPTLEAGDAGRIAHGATAAPTGMALAGILRSGDELLLRYTRVS
jgi:riboflavin biosynthesis pyrimidine reductase